MDRQVEQISVVGLGYVGLPVALALARRFRDVVGFDVTARQAAAAREDHDWTGEIHADEAAHESGALLSPNKELQELDGLIVALNNDAFVQESKALTGRLEGRGVFIDVKSARTAICRAL